MVDVPEPPHHHHHKTGLPWFDLIMPLAVLAISIASLLTALDSGNLDKGRIVLSLTLSNVGTGPARIAWLHITDAQGNDALAASIEKQVDKLLSPNQLDPGKANLQSAFQSTQIEATLMRSGEDRPVWKWPRPTANPAAIAEWEKLNTARFHLRASACYCSIFDECRITEFGTSRPEPVASCDQPQPRP